MTPSLRSLAAAAAAPLLLIALEAGLGTSPVPFLQPAVGAPDAERAEHLVGERGPELQDTIHVLITNQYDATLSVMGIPGVTRQGRDWAYGRLNRGANNTYTGQLRGFAQGSMRMETLFGRCADESDAKQLIYAVAHIEQPPESMTPRNAGASYGGQGVVRGSQGEFDLTFVFFPDGPMEFVNAGQPAAPGLCQGHLHFDGYSPGSNTPLFPWVPTQRDPGDFIPFNDTRWTTQNGLRLHAPPAGGMIEYWDDRDTHPVDGVRQSLWTVSMWRGEG